MNRAADTYKMAAGILVFIIFLSTGTFMLAESFQDITPAGMPNPKQIQQSANNAPFTVGNCTKGDWGCAITNFFATIGNGLVNLGIMATAVGGFFISLLTFQIPALQANPFTQLVNFLIVVPLIVVLGLFIFRLAKSAIPTVGGEPD